MSHFKIGQPYDSAFTSMPTKEIQDNLEAVAYGIQEKAYTKNLSAEEIVQKKDEYAQIGLSLSDIAREKKDFAAEMKFREKEPKEKAVELLAAIQFKSEQKTGKLYLVDDQEEGMMYFFDPNGICVEARMLDKKEKQTKLKVANEAE